MTTLTIELPDTLAAEAEQAGLLTPSALEAILRESLRRSASNELFLAADQLAAAEFPPMTMEEIQREVNADRSQRRPRATGA